MFTFENVNFPMKNSFVRQKTFPEILQTSTTFKTPFSPFLCGQDITHECARTSFIMAADQVVNLWECLI